jgi:hypothetical protein
MFVIHSIVFYLFSRTVLHRYEGGRMNESDIRDELARIVSRFGGEVSPAEVPDDIVQSYLHGLSTGQWYLKTPRAKDSLLVLRAIAGINAAIEAESLRELDEAGRVLLGAVMQAMGGQHSTPFLDKISCEWQPTKLRILQESIGPIWGVLNGVNAISVWKI